jgi:hypothetical protein
MTKRKGGGRYRRFRARILARDVGCTEPACPNRSTQLHHDPALVEGGQELNPNHARGVCGPCHQRLSAELRERLGLPYSPSSNPPARPVEKAGPSSGPQGLARAGSSLTRGVARRRPKMLDRLPRVLGGDAGAVAVVAAPAGGDKVRRLPDQLRRLRGRDQVMDARRVAAAAWPSDLADVAVAGKHGLAELLPGGSAVAGISHWLVVQVDDA